MKKVFKFEKRHWLLIAMGVALLFFLFAEFLGGQFEKATVVYETELEEKLSSMIETLDGILKADVLVTLDSYEEGKGTPKVRGVAIICHGKAKEEMKVKIIMLASTALGVSSDKIFVSFG